MTNYRELPIENLRLPRRTQNALFAEDIRIVGDLLVQSEKSLLRFSSLGRKGINEIKEAIAEMGLRLGDEKPRWDEDIVIVQGRTYRLAEAKKVYVALQGLFG